MSYSCQASQEMSKLQSVLVTKESKKCQICTLIPCLYICTQEQLDLPFIAHYLNNHSYSNLDTQNQCLQTLVLEIATYSL